MFVLFESQLFYSPAGCAWNWYWPVGQKRTWHGSPAGNDTHGRLHCSACRAFLLLGISFRALGSRLGAVRAQRQQPVLQLLHYGRLVLQEKALPRSHEIVCLQLCHH